MPLSLFSLVLLQTHNCFPEFIVYSSGEEASTPHIIAYGNAFVSFECKLQTDDSPYFFFKNVGVSHIVSREIWDCHVVI